MVNGDVDTGRVTVGIGDAGIDCEVDLGSVDDLSCEGLQFSDLVSCGWPLIPYLSHLAILTPLSKPAMTLTSKPECYSH